MQISCSCQHFCEKCFFVKNVKMMTYSLAEGLVEFVPGGYLGKVRKF